MIQTFSCNECGIVPCIMVMVDERSKFRFAKPTHCPYGHDKKEPSWKEVSNIDAKKCTLCGQPATVALCNECENELIGDD